jgi:hypothetical protein
MKMPWLSATGEKRLFQSIVLLASIVPIVAGAAGALLGPGMIHAGLPTNRDLDSHFRYLSGLLLGIGLGFIWSVVRIEKRSLLFRALGLIVIVGGLSRLLGAIEDGVPGPAHLFPFVMELLVVPALLLWLLRIGRADASHTGRSSRSIPY